MVIPLFVGREKSIQALEQAMANDKKIFLVAQKDAGQDDPNPDDIYRIGTISTILQLLKLPDGTVKVLVEGGERARVEAFSDDEDYFGAELTVLDSADAEEDAREIEVLTRAVLAQFEQYVKLNKKVPPEILASLTSIEFWKSNRGVKGSSTWSRGSRKRSISCKSRNVSAGASSARWRRASASTT
jgi:ATP-dependent Lon protease